MTPVDLDDLRPLGLRFVARAVNDVDSADAWRQATTEHGDAALGQLPFEAEGFREATSSLHVLFGEKRLPKAAAMINDTLRRASATDEMVELPDGRWALRPRFPADATAAEALRSLGAFALGRWASERGRCAWGVCEATGCSRVFVDEGRREPQRFCSTACATRTRVAAHRRRRQGPAVSATGEAVTPPAGAGRR